MASLPLRLKTDNANVSILITFGKFLYACVMFLYPKQLKWYSTEDPPYNDSVCSKDFAVKWSLLLLL